MQTLLIFVSESLKLKDMQRSYLLPYVCKKVGMWMSMPFFALCLWLILSGELELDCIRLPVLVFGIVFFYDFSFLYFVFAAIYFVFILYVVRFNWEMQAARRGKE